MKSKKIHDTYLSSSKVNSEVTVNSVSSHLLARMNVYPLIKLKESDVEVITLSDKILITYNANFFHFGQMTQVNSRTISQGSQERFSRL